MRPENIQEGSEYILSHAYGQKEQKVVVLSINISEQEVLVEYVSNDVSKGMTTTMNRIECDRYLHKI
jgi:anti-sigma regulatory factor (Ser/Thr protein kinase)